MEHRRSERVDVALPVLVKVNGGGFIPGTIRNLSTGGMFIQLRKDLPLHSQVIVNINQRGRSARRACQLPVVVARQDVGGLGVRYLSVGDAGEVVSAAMSAH